MPRILFITMHRPDRSPGQRYRFEQYLADLTAAGWEYDIHYLLDEKDDKIFYSKGFLLQKALILVKSFKKRLKSIRAIDKYDVVFVYREALPTWHLFFEKSIKKHGKKLIFDFDDAIWIENTSKSNRFFSFLKNPGKTAAICSLADHVIVGNAHLANYAKTYSRSVEIIPTTIDMEVYNRSIEIQEKDNLIIGWSGSTTTIEHLRWVEPLLERINKRHKNIQFKIIGSSDYTKDSINSTAISWQSSTEVDELLTFDIGIMPLPNDPWTAGKCGCKGLQYMALGIPTLISDVGLNREIIRNEENGVICGDLTSFETELERMIIDVQFRKKIGPQGRQTVIEKYSRQAWRKRYVALFEEVVNKK